MCQQVTLTIIVCVPVAQHLGAVGAAPDKVEGVFPLHQQGGARARPGEPPRQLIVGANEEHPVDAGDGRQVEAGGVEKGWQGRGVAEAVGKVGDPRLLCHTVGTQPLLPDEENAQDRLGIGQQRVGGGYTAAGQTQTALVDEGSDSVMLLWPLLPVLAQEEDALDRVDATWVAQQLVDGTIEVGADESA